MQSSTMAHAEAASLLQTRTLSLLCAHSTCGRSTIAGSKPSLLMIDREVSTLAAYEICEQSMSGHAARSYHPRAV